MSVSKVQAKFESGLHPAPSNSIGRKRESRMTLIPAGPFLMGSSNGSGAETPEHLVDVADFRLDQTPVTNREYAEFCDESGYRTEVERAGSAWGVREGKYQPVEGLSWRTYFTPDREEHPVVLVTWNDAVAYCEWADARLPTEAEWEKAARGGQIATMYPWGDEAPDGTQSNFAATASEIPGTTEVRCYPPNNLDLYDMVGNVWQWCSDWYGEQYYAEGPSSNPTGATTGTTRVRRGGSWNVIQAFRLRCANRGAMSPSQTATNMGFRCARS
jgi:sulfatase modifying factor 1